MEIYMKAVIYKEPFKMAVEEVQKPEIKSGEEIILKVTSAAICGSDLHMYEGRVAIEPGTIFGHEILGVVDEVGDAVQSINKGDRVVLPFNISCGFCFNCLEGLTSACLTMNPSKPAAGYGYANMGPYEGGQAEYVRVPFADFNCTKVPGRPHDEFEDDFVLCADVFPTGYHATELALVGPGKVVVIFGAGPVGLMAAYSSLIKGASQVYVVDYIEERLEKAASIGAIPINFSKGSPVQQILNHRRKNKLFIDSLRPGEAKMNQILCGIDAIGYEALSDKEPTKQDPMQVISNLVELVDYTAHIGIVGVFFPMDPGGVDENAKQGKFLFPLGMAFEKGLSIAGSQTPVKKYDRYLRELIITGRAKPSFIVSKHISIDEAPDAYARFDKRESGYTKVIIKFK
jgi:glutathione-independent formaldehyde dehydrogenase